MAQRAQMNSEDVPVSTQQSQGQLTQRPSIIDPFITEVSQEAAVDLDY